MGKRKHQQISFSDQLRNAIQSSELTRYQIAKQAGIEQSALSRFMSGERGLSTSTLDLLTAALNLELVQRDPNGPQQDKR